MVADERMLAYIRSLDRGERALIRTIREEAQAADVPVIRQETAGLLRVLLRMTKPEKLLEVGTAVGFSALFMCEYLDADAHVTTIENSRQRILTARENFKRAGRAHMITLIEGDASEVLGELPDGFDFVLMDAAKGQYIRLLPEVRRLLRVGGTLVSDNVLQDGDVAESRFAVPRRKRTIHSRMREYLWALTHSEDFETVVLPIGDGVAVSTRVAAN